MSAPVRTPGRATVTALPINEPAIDPTADDGDRASTEGGAGEHSTPGDQRDGVRPPEHRRLVLFAAVLVAVATVGAIGFGVGRRVTSPADAAAQRDPLAPGVVTVPLESRTLTSRLVLRGTVEFSEAMELTLAGSVGGDGESQIVTREAAVDTVLDDGDVVAEVSGRPIFVLEGATPMYRSLRPGMSGEDVRQLEQALARHGLDVGAIDGLYDAATADAVARFYGGAGFTASGPSESARLELSVLDEARQQAAQELRDATAALDVATAPPDQVTMAELDAAVFDAQGRLDRAAAEQASTDRESAVTIAASETSATVASEAWTVALARLDQARSTGTTPAGEPCDSACSDELGNAEAQARAARDIAAAALESAKGQGARMIANASAEAESARRSLDIARLRRNAALEPASSDIMQQTALDAAARLVAADAALATAISASGVIVPAGEVVFLDRLPIRVDEALTRQGELLSGPFARVSDEQLVVRAGVAPADRDLIAIGTIVEISATELGLATTGEVVSVAEQIGGGVVEPDRHEVVIRPLDPAIAEPLAGHGVVVTITTISTDGDVLVVPVAAVNTIADGTSQIEVRRPDGTLVRIQVGLGFAAEGFVEVIPSDGAALAAGDAVVIGVPGVDDAGIAVSSPIIRLEAATRTYEGPPAVRALDAVELVVEHGEHVAIVGPSGSGKSTMLGILGLLDRVDLGRYLFDGIDTTTLSERDLAALRAQRIGFVFQAFHLLPHRSVEDNVALSGMYRHLTRRQRRRCAVDALDRVGLAHRRTQAASTLSGGERQRVAIARAVCTAPDLLLCDEPTGNLDADNTEAVLDLLADLGNDGITIVTITHDPYVSARADRTVRLVDGRTKELMPEMSQ